eukprot:TRINITY_DN8164_c0_g1_i2.p1 TRINITY_DN8164_c0_g1~~TRINITY_DN8164_c0_g1_i2.p1  ORF type:complete len:446 (-),score=97.71 TRINITY_DN8164_c0_g1_i2:112-1449(-)
MGHASAPTASAPACGMLWPPACGSGEPESLPGEPLPSPPPPCFSDVLEAQRWASQIVRQAELEACRRGSRGSPAWEDAWRDALWTLAVQKRCVEVEARKCCAAAAAAATARRSSKTAGSPAMPAPPGASCSPRQPAAQAETGRPATPTDVAERALREGAAAFERQCLEPVHKRLDNFEDRLARLSTALQEASASRVSASASRDQHYSEPSRMSGTAGPLPADMHTALGCGSSVMAGSTSFVPAPWIAEPHGEPQVARHHAALEARCGQLMQELQQAQAARSELQHKLRVSEASNEEVHESLRKSEMLLDACEKECGEAPTLWRQRHCSLQRQLRRTEVALGGAHQGASRSSRESSLTKSKWWSAAKTETDEELGEPEGETGLREVAAPGGGFSLASAAGGARSIGRSGRLAPFRLGASSESAVGAADGALQLWRSARASGSLNMS